MELTRRQFLKATGVAATVGVVFVACRIPERELIKQSPRDLPEDLALGLDNWYATSCALCNNSHGVIVRVIEGRAKKIEGNPDHPVNRGKLSARCLAGVQSLYHPDRITGPLRRRSGGNFEPIENWAVAYDDLAQQIRSADPAKSVLITEPQRGHLGQVIQSFSRATGIRHMALEPLEQTVVRQAVKEVFGQDRLPHFDIANAHSILSIGADFLETWISPVEYNQAYGEFRQGQGRSRGTLIHADSRFSMTAANADTWIPVAPGQEGTLALSIAQVLVSEGLADAAAVGRVLPGGANALEAYAPDAVAGQIGATPDVVTPERIREVAKTLAEQRPALVIAGGSAAAQSNGLFNVKAALILNYLLGSVGVKGGVIANAAPPLPELAGLGAVATYADWKDLRDRLNRGEIDLVLLHGANPAYSLAGLGFADALSKAKAIVSFSTIVDESTAAASLVLPDLHTFESWGTQIPDPAPGYPVITVQQPVVPLLRDQSGKVVFDGRAFGDVLLATADKLGQKGAMPAADSMEKLVEAGFQALHQANPDRGSVQSPNFNAFWVGVLQRGGWWNAKAAAPAAAGAPALPERAEASFVGPAGAGTYALIPFSHISIHDGSGAYLPWAQQTPDPLTTAVWRTWVEVNSREASRLGLRDGDVVRLEGPAGTIEAPVALSPAHPPGIVSVPFGQGHVASGQYAKDRGENAFTALGDATVEGTGALAWAATRVKLVRTGRRVRIPRFEGGFMAPSELEDTQVIQLTQA